MSRVERNTSAVPPNPQAPAETFTGTFEEKPARRAKSCFTRLADGHYVEPYHPNLVDYEATKGGATMALHHSKSHARERRVARARARDAEISATVVCVRRASQNILVRFMPREEWVHIKKQDEVLSVKPGHLGETTEHVVASPLLRTMPGPPPPPPSVTAVPDTAAELNGSRSVSPMPLPMVSIEPTQDDSVTDPLVSLAATSTAGGEASLFSMSRSAAGAQPRAATSMATSASRSVQFIPWSCYMNESNRAADASVSEPLVYDYFVPPENVAAKVRSAKHKSVTGYMRYKMSYSPNQVQAMEKEYRRSYLAVERRNIFLWQLQRDLQARLHRDPTYVVARVVPEEFTQTFFLLREEQTARARFEARESARTPEEAARLIRQMPVHLFALDHTFSQLPFAGQAASDGFVVVSIGDPSTANKASVFEFADDDDDAPFVPHFYGSASYTRRPENSPDMDTTPTVSRASSVGKGNLGSSFAATDSATSVPGGDLSLGSPDTPLCTEHATDGVVPVLAPRTSSKRHGTHATTAKSASPKGSPGMPGPHRTFVNTTATNAQALQDDSPLHAGKASRASPSPQSPTSPPRSNAAKRKPGCSL